MNWVLKMACTEMASRSGRLGYKECGVPEWILPLSRFCDLSQIGKLPQFLHLENKNLTSMAYFCLDLMMDLGKRKKMSGEEWKRKKRT